MGASGDYMESAQKNIYGIIKEYGNTSKKRIAPSYKTAVERLERLVKTNAQEIRGNNWQDALCTKGYFIYKSVHRSSAITSGNVEHM